MNARSTTTTPDTHHVGSSVDRLSDTGLFAVLVAVTLPVMSFFSVNVALGVIDAELDASSAMLQLIVAGYGVVYASLVVVGGRLGDRLGRRRVLLIGLGGFLVTSLLCAAAQTPEQLVAGRLLQGVAAALTTPQVLASIHANTEGHHRNRALGMFGATMGIATSLAFLIGGALTGADVDWLGWRAVFWVNVPIGLLVMFAVARWLPESRGSGRTPLDLPGALLLAATLSLLVIPLTEGRALGWPRWTWIMLAALVPAALVFAWWQRRSERSGSVPLVPPSMMRLRSMAVGLPIAAAFFTVFGGFMFIYALVAQSGGLSPLGIGISLLPMSLSFLLASILVDRAITRFGVTVLTVGALVAALGYAGIGAAVFADRPDLSAWVVLVPMLVTGLGMGFVMSPLFGIVLSQVPAERAGLGSGVLITTQQLSLGLGSAVIGTIYLSNVDQHGPAASFAGSVVIVTAAMLVVAAMTRFLTPRGA